MSASTLGHVGVLGQKQQHPAHVYHRHAYQTSGTPGTALESAWPLPGAMMNHFVISNWYDERGDFEEFGLGEANFGVKVMKYYAGAELCGSVSVPDLDIGLIPIPTFSSNLTFVTSKSFFNILRSLSDSFEFASNSTPQ